MTPPAVRRYTLAWPTGRLEVALSAERAEVDVRVESEGRLLVLVEREAPPPRPGTFDVRSEGLWLSLVEEEPGRWTIGLEAFTLEVADPADELGYPTPLGLDVEWEAGHLHGELLTDHGAEPLDTPATWEISGS